MMRDFLGDLIRSADPGPQRRDAVLSESAQHGLAQFRTRQAEQQRETQPGASARRSWWRQHRIFTLAASTALVAVLIIAGISINTTPSSAVTPPMLSTSEIHGDAAALLTELAETRLQYDNPHSVIHEQAWSLSINIADDESIESSTVEPHWRTTSFESNGSVHEQIVAAEPFPGQEDEDLPSPGTVIQDQVYPAGEWYGIEVPDPPINPDQYDRYFSEWTGGEVPTAARVLQEIRGLLSVRIFSPEQESALLSYLGTLDGLTVAGETVDRLGRDGVVFEARNPDFPDFEIFIVISPDTGKIIAFEEVYVGTDRTDIPSPSVVDYAVWSHDLSEMETQ